MILTKTQYLHISFPIIIIINIAFQFFYLHIYFYFHIIHYLLTILKVFSLIFQGIKQNNKKIHLSTAVSSDPRNSSLKKASPPLWIPDFLNRGERSATRNFHQQLAYVPYFF